MVYEVAIKRATVSDNVQERVDNLRRDGERAWWKAQQRAGEARSRIPYRFDQREILNVIGERNFKVQTPHSIFCVAA